MSKVITLDLYSSFIDGHVDAYMDYLEATPPLLTKATAHKLVNDNDEPKQLSVGPDSDLTIRTNPILI